MSYIVLLLFMVDILEK